MAPIISDILETLDDGYSYDDDSDDECSDDDDSDDECSDDDDSDYDDSDDECITTPICIVLAYKRIV